MFILQCCGTPGFEFKQSLMNVNQSAVSFVTYAEGATSTEDVLYNIKGTDHCYATLGISIQNSGIVTI